MLLGYNTNGLQNHRLPDALRLMADNGYEAVGLTLDVQHLDPFHCTAKDVSEVAVLLDQLGLTPAMETGARFLLDPKHKHEPTLMTRDPEARARRIEFFRRVAGIGRDLGASVVSFFSGVDRGPSADARETLLSGVRDACAAVRAEGMIPAVEPEPGMAIATVEEYQEVRRELEKDGEGPMLCLDVGHLYVTGEGSPAQVIPGVAAQLAQVQLEDMRIGVHEHLLPGEGDVDFAAVFSALREAKYAGPVCFELSRSSHLAPHAIAICRQVWAGSR